MIAKTGFRTRIALPFVITAAALVFVGLFSVNTSRNLVSDTDDISGNYMPAISEVLNGDRDLYQALVAQMAAIDAGFNQGDISALSADFNENVQQAYDRFNQAVARLRGTGVMRSAEGFEQAFQQWEASARQVVELAKNGNAERARALSQQTTQPLFDQLRDYFDRVGAHTEQLAQERAVEASSEGVSSSVTTLVITRSEEHT